ncbi:zinc knuckle CX2CX4HX4C containing protein [Tanacetum coccineum]
MDQRSKPAVKALLRANHGANTDVEALLRDFSQRMDSLARQGASLSDASTHGVDAMLNSNPESEFLIHNIDDVAKFFGVPLSSLNEIDDFTIELEAGNNQLWLGQTMDIRSWISDLIVEKCNNLLELQKKAIMVENKQSSEVLLDDPIVKNFDVHDKPSSYVSATGGSKTKQMKLKANFHPLSSDNLCEGANVSIPRKIVKTVSSRLANTLYGYFIGFFFFQFKTPKGLEDVLENGPWMIRKSPIILKKWNMNTRLCKDELARILVWVKIHDVPIQAFTEDGLSIIASKIGKPIMLDSYTSSMCIKSWGRSSFARCLIEINAEDVLLDSLTIGIPCEDDGFSIEIVSIEYEWKPPRCDLCKIFGYSHDYYPKKVLIPIVDTSKVITPNVVNTSTIPTPSVEKTNDGFQTVGKKKKKLKMFLMKRLIFLIQNLVEDLLSRLLLVNLFC